MSSVRAESHHDAGRGPQLLTVLRSLSHVAGWALALGLLAVAVKMRWLSPVDLWMAEWVASIRSPGFTEVTKAIAFFGSSPWALGVMVVMSLWWWRQRVLIVVFWGTWLLGFAMQALLRVWVAQWRPDTALIPVGADVLMRYDLAGFTSGHTFRSAFLYGWWALWCARHQADWAKWGRLGCLAFIVLVGFTRLYLDRHWLTDVVGAWFLAALVLTLAQRLQGPTPEQPRGS